MIDQPTGLTPIKFYTHCPRCGASPLEAFGQHPRCKACGFVCYQNPHTAVAGFIVNDEGKVLFVERGEEPRKGTWDIPGGFVDWGEDPTTAIIREMDEELHVKFSPHWCLGAYHGWYDAQGLAVSCVTIYYVGRFEGTLRPDSDAARAEWFSVDALPQNLAFEHMERALADYRRLSPRVH